MIFLIDLAFAMLFIALGVGVALLVWSYRNEGAGVGVAKVFGYIIVIATAATLLCTTYHASSYWSRGHHKYPMMQKEMMKNDMMKQQMMQQKNMMQNN